MSVIKTSDTAYVLMRKLVSTTTALGANSTYTSSKQTVAGFSRLVGTVYADQDGTLYVEQSSDGTNYDVTSSFSVTGGTGLGFSVEIVAPFARIKYTNGANAQTTFRLYAFGRTI